MNGFCWYARKMVRRSFSVFAIDDRALVQSPISDNAPLIVYANHPGWWDPIVGMLLCREYFPKRSYYAPIDAEALKKYPAFKKLGYYGIELDSSAGAVSFLKISSQILAMSDSSLWITPEGKFTDPRDSNRQFMPGISHLATKHPNVVCLPLAIEYPFLEERHPFALCRFGRPIRSEGDANKTDLNKHLLDAFRDTQGQLAHSVIRREFSGFRVLLQSKAKKHGNLFERPNG